MTERVDSEWADQTRIVRDGGTVGQDSRFSVELFAGWSVGGGINGGYLLSIIGRAAAETLPEHPDPFVVSAHYLSASTAGPAQLRTRVLRTGGSTATVRIELSQGGILRVAATATSGRLAGLDREVATTAQELELAPRDQCLSTDFAPPELQEIAPLMSRFEMLFDPSCVGWAMGRPSGRGELKAWFRLEEQPSPLSLLLALDALPPVTFDLGRPGWAPTIELTAHVRALPAPGWLKIGQRTRNVAGGMFEEDCEVWDSAGRLVAQARQLAVLPR